MVQECLEYYGTSKHPFIPSEFPVEILIDTSIPNDEIALYLDAVDLWNEALNSEVLYATITQDLYGMHGDCNFATVGTTPFLAGDHAGLTTFGPCASDHVAIVTSPILSDAEIRTVAAHELGHVLGAPHDDDDPTSVMFPKLGTSRVVISERSQCMVKIAVSAAER